MTWPPHLAPSDNWPADVADPMREAGRTQVWGRQRSYGRPDIANPRDGVRGIHPSSRAPIPSRDDRGRTSAQGPEPTVLTQRIRRQAESTG
ncbi:hypothetical protein B296_00009631 [Ensete ventricosum]|uniref:Uncharacterized protein n=1 Tax=Ensete ventricosum TaxID=4639 RepID=A0A426ZBE3_ENSVE|nr:hypothetical protein B296_00009631 [Ensete ventricosum]